MKAIVIDDAPDIRIYVSALLRKWGYEVEEASEGLEGFSRIKEAGIQVVVCDWMMPGMSGPELCQAIREADLGHYVYVILLTGRSDKADLLEGLNAGADDFLSKPFDAQVLQARLRVGERILGLEQRLAEQNRELRDSRNRLERAYRQIQTDIAAAAHIQVQMLPTTDRVLSPFRAEWLFLPAAQLSGDSFNFFELTADMIGFYLLDVVGHGIPSALLSTSLSRSLTPAGAGACATARADFLDPARFLANLTRQLSDPDGDIENFATIVYGTLDRRTGEVTIALGGHPRPMILHADGGIDYLELGGLPVGMFPDADYESQVVHLAPGDRLILYSDGITECRNQHGELFGDEQMQATVRAPSTGLTVALSERLRAWRGQDDFEDDISVLVLERPLEPSEAPQHMAPQVQLDLHSNPAEISELQVRLSALCVEAGLDDLAAFQLTCAIIEAVNNIVEHAYKGEAEHPISLTWHRGSACITVEIRDRGLPMAVPPPENPGGADAYAESGRGWQIIREWTDTARYSREGEENLLTLTRRLQTP